MVDLIVIFRPITIEKCLAAQVLRSRGRVYLSVPVYLLYLPRGIAFSLTFKSAFNFFVNNVVEVLFAEG